MSLLDNESMLEMIKHETKNSCAVYIQKLASEDSSNLTPSFRACLHIVENTVAEHKKNL